MTFHDRLKELRISRNLTQKDVAESVGMSQMAYQRYEYGTREPAYKKLVALANFFDVPIDYLSGRSNDVAVAVACAVPKFFHESLFQELEKIGISREHIVSKSPRAAVVGEGFIVDELTPKEAQQVANIIVDWFEKNT